LNEKGPQDHLDQKRSEGHFARRVFNRLNEDSRTIVIGRSPSGARPTDPKFANSEHRPENHWLGQTTFTVHLHVRAKLGEHP
jgi:hypothetical protein